MKSSSKGAGLRLFNGVAEYLTSGSSSKGGSMYGSATVLTIGNFDGVHLGHRELIRRTVERAREKQVPSVVFTFEPHPLAVLRPDLKLKRLFDADDRRDQIGNLGVDVLVVEPFSRSFSQLTPEKFLIDSILRPFQPRSVVVGYDFSFGANRAGSIDFLKSHSTNVGVPFDLEVVPPVTIDLAGKPTVVSSTRIRQALAAGNASEARELLGRPFVLRGLIKKGKGRGKTIGIPTANIDPTVESGILPGVYAAIARVRDRNFAALVNIGRNPTFEVDSGELHVEAHLPRYDGKKEGDLYGEMLELGFVQRIRDEKKFSSAEELVQQIHTDIQQGTLVLKKEGL